MARLLLVDDDPVVARAVSRVLVRAGHTVEHCVDPLLVLDVVRARPFDLVITDFRMPGLDGLRLASVISAERPGLPIVLLTGSFDIDLVRVEAAGVVAVLAKPVDSDALIDLVRRHLRPEPDPPQRRS